MVWLFVNVNCSHWGPSENRCKDGANREQSQILFELCRDAANTRRGFPENRCKDTTFQFDQIRICPHLAVFVLTCPYLYLFPYFLCLHISPFLPKFAQTIAYSMMNNTPHRLTFATLDMQLYSGLQIRQDGKILKI